jgi:hypothetical protein
MSATEARAALAELDLEERRLRCAHVLTLGQGSQGPLSIKLRRRHRALATAPCADNPAPSAPRLPVPGSLASLANPAAQAAEQRRIDTKRQDFVRALLRADKAALFTVPVVRAAYDRAIRDGDLLFLQAFGDAVASLPDVRIRRRAYLRRTQHIVEAWLRSKRLTQIATLRRDATAAELRGDVAERERLDDKATALASAPPPSARTAVRLAVAQIAAVARKKGAPLSPRDRSALRRRLGRARPSDDPLA